MQSNDISCRGGNDNGKCCGVKLKNVIPPGRLTGNNVTRFISSIVESYMCFICGSSHIKCPSCEIYVYQHSWRTGHYTSFMAHTKNEHHCDSSLIILGDYVYVRFNSDYNLLIMTEILELIPQLSMLKFKLFCSDTEKKIIQLDGTTIYNSYYGAYSMNEETFHVMMDYLTAIEYSCYMCDFEYDSLPTQEIVKTHMHDCSAHMTS